MAPNVTIYCLENVSDYSEFERLCHDLMARKGYSNIEPLGGFKDKGRDAVHKSQSSVTSVFAYSVREDWRAKLAEDAAKIHKHGHSCGELVFLSTARFTAGERDEAIAFISKQYGWRLELYGVERLRILLEVDHPDIRVLHPQIFPPQFYPTQPLSTSSASQEHLFISAASEDAVFADWLTKKLTAEGYRVWWEGAALLGGEMYPDDVDNAIRAQAFRVLALYSLASLANPEVMRQRNLALSIARERKTDFLIPANVDGVQPHQLDRVTASLAFVPFHINWATGFKQLLRKLEAVGCPKPVLAGKTIAAGAFLEDEILSGKPEILYANCLPVEHLPMAIHLFETGRDLHPGTLQSLRFQWAFRKITPKAFLSFHEPDRAILSKHNIRRVDSIVWAREHKMHGISTRNLVVELIRKSLVVKCQQKGLHFCQDTGLQYFPLGLIPGERLKFVRPDGSKSFVQVTGQRKYWRPQGSEDYRYSLAPAFFAVKHPFDDFMAMMKVRVRITDTSGRVLPKRTINSRRKDLCGDWWNTEWFSRLLAICQFLTDNGKITVGKTNGEQIILSGVPLSMIAPVSINEQALDPRNFERNETLMRRDDEDEGAEEGNNQNE